MPNVRAYGNSDGQKSWFPTVLKYAEVWRSGNSQIRMSENFDSRKADFEVAHGVEGVARNRRLQIDMLIYFDISGQSWNSMNSLFCQLAQYSRIYHPFATVSVQCMWMFKSSDTRMVKTCKRLSIHRAECPHMWQFRCPEILMSDRTEARWI